MLRVSVRPWALSMHLLLALLAAFAVSLPLSSAAPSIAPYPTPRPLETVLEYARNFSGSNADWQPYITVQSFDGVAMVLVPAGCFTMGSTDEQIEDAILFDRPREWFDAEQPAHEICFDTPFWIDLTEVTNAQFGSSGRWEGDQLPREMVSWDEAGAHCESRGARLPTEAEWEYAARGPDGLVYPWGDAFDGSRLNFCDANCVYPWGVDDSTEGPSWKDTSVDDGYARTAPVGSYPEGASWVGALDMSGNVWERTSSLYWWDYPYDADDGRENPDGADFRVVRGGSWVEAADLLRSAYRSNRFSTSIYNDVGFRCARAVDTDS